MKYYIPGLLVSYLIYSAIVPTQPAHSFILFSLAGLYGFNLFLEQKREHSSKYTEFAQIQERLEKSIKEQKETSDARIAKLEEELSKVSLTITRVSPSSKKNESNKTMVF